MSWDNSFRRDTPRCYEYNNIQKGQRNATPPPPSGKSLLPITRFLLLRSSRDKDGELASTQTRCSTPSPYSAPAASIAPPPSQHFPLPVVSSIQSFDTRHIRLHFIILFYCVLTFNTYLGIHARGPTPPFGPYSTLLPTHWNA